MVKRVSLKMIAQKIGISTALVSYVLNGREKEMRVAPEMAEKIRKVAGELNYKPNLVALSLRRGSTMTIGLILADIANPFFGQLARVIEDEANKFGYTVVFGSSDESKIKSDTLLETLINRQVDGFIIIPAEDSQEQIKGLLKSHIPVVLVDRYFPEINTSFVVLDNYRASADAVSRLISNGYKRIGIVAYKSTLVHMKERIRGYVDTMRLNGRENSIIISEIQYNQVYQEIDNTILTLCVNEKRVDALFFATNSLSIAGLYSIKKYGIKVPDELAILGFDGNESFDFFYSPVSYVEQPIQEIGIESVRILVDLLKGSTKSIQANLKHRLIVRQSSGGM